jgi:hypothetical protein
MFVAMQQMLDLVRVGPLGRVLDRLWPRDRREREPDEFDGIEAAAGGFGY